MNRSRTLLSKYTPYAAATGAVMVTFAAAGAVAVAAAAAVETTAP